MLPVKNHYNSSGGICSPFELFTGTKPTISHFCVFGCPAVAKRSVIYVEGLSTQHCTETGLRGVFIGVPFNQKGYLIYLPGSRNIACSGDAIFDETFYSAVATTWRRFEEGIDLKPSSHVIPGPDMELETTGDILSMHDDVMPDFGDYNGDIPVAPYIADDEQPVIPRPHRTRLPPRRLSFDIHQPDRDWNELANICSDTDLLTACAADATVQLDSPGADASILEPAPANLRAVLRLRDTTIREAWFKAYQKELKTIIDSGTFHLGDNPLPGESCTPIMDLNVVKLRSDGTLDKLKNHLVVRENLQRNVEEDIWSPTASFRALKLLLAHAARLKVRVRQLDFVGTFLQAKVRRQIFVKIPAIYGSIFPEFQKHCGIRFIFEIIIWDDFFWKILVSRLDGIFSAHWLYSEYSYQMSIL